MSIPFYITQWITNKGWKLRSFQKKMFLYHKKKYSVILMAPTGEGKTLASFLPILASHASTTKGLRTLYISPLKALTTDVERNLFIPVQEMGLNIKIETRTGDTSAYRRKRQLSHPPHILLTTPESLMLLLSYPNATSYFTTLETVIVDELHTFIASERGDFTALALSRLKSIAPNHHRIGLSATASDPVILAKWLSASHLVTVKPKHLPQIELLTSCKKIPYSGYRATYAIHDIYAQLLQQKTTLLFTNTRKQAELMFNELWQINTEGLAIAIYHSSLDKALRKKIETLARSHQLRCIVATSALELGIDWEAVDCVMQIGAPKSVNRLIQRAGRSNHTALQKSFAYLVPTNALEFLECQAAITAVKKNQLDVAETLEGALEIISQYIMTRACSEKITPEILYQEIIQAYPYRNLSYQLFEKILRFVIDGGYVLRHYEQHHRLKSSEDNQYEIVSAKIAHQHRQNIGVIVDGNKIKIKQFNKRGTKIIGEMSEYFVLQLKKGDTFLLGGINYEFVRMREGMGEVKKSMVKKAKMPSYGGSMMSFSTSLAEGVYELIAHRPISNTFPQKIKEWLTLQTKFSTLPIKNQCLIEHFPHKKTFFTVIYTFLGAKANHTLGALLCDAMEMGGCKPLQFTISDYGIAINSLYSIESHTIHQIWENNFLISQLEKWVWESAFIKSAFRHIAVVAGLVTKKRAGTTKSNKQITFSTDLIFDVLKRHEPDHILLLLAYQRVMRNLIDVERLKEFLLHFQHITFRSLPFASPLALPIIFSYRTEKLQGTAIEDLLNEMSIEKHSLELIAVVRQHVDKH